MAKVGAATKAEEVAAAATAGGITRTVRVQYRRATLDGEPKEAVTLQERLDRALKTDLSKDVSKRLFNIMATDEGPQGCINTHQSTALAFVADIMHFDGRAHSLRFIHSDKPTPVGKIEPREIAEGESSLGEPVYFMARGNHLAVIERPGFALTQFARYINALLAAAGELETGTAWKFAPKIEYSSATALGGAVKKVIFRPRAAFDGYGVTRAPEPKRRKRGTQAIIEDVLANGTKLLEILEAAGADQTKIETLRQAMSSDLAIRAKLELSVVQVRKKTTAEVSPDIMQKALADLADDGDVEIVAADGRTQGKLVSLSHKTDVLEVEGLLEWSRATEALASALAAWYARGAIDLSDNN